MNYGILFKLDRKSRCVDRYQSYKPVTRPGRMITLPIILADTNKF